MKPIEEFKVSLYEVNNSVKCVQVSLINILRGIITGELKDKVNAIRHYMEDGDVQAANILKARLPAFTSAGVFNGGHSVKNLMEGTGLITLDFDHALHAIDLLRTVCNADPHTLASFRSPKDGFKVIVHVEYSAERHKEAYELVRLHYEELTGMKLDTSGSDLSRTCLMSYDPQGYIATLYDSFVLPPAPPQKEEPTESVAAQRKETGTEPEESFLGREEAFVSANLLLHPLREGNRNNGSYALGCRAAKAGCDFEAIYTVLAQKICNEDFKDSDLKRNLQSAYQSVTHEMNAPGSKTSETAVGDMATKRHYITQASSEAEKEAYKKGEELRMRTPLFPDELYDNIPPILCECLEPDLLPRERDGRILSCLVAFSALMPKTWAKYGRKRYSPHLYAWIIAPPASGKGAAAAALHLLDVTNDIIEKESDAQQDKYERLLEEYNECRLHNKKTKEKTELPEKPAEPPYRSLVIPANTSNSRVIVQLRDNAELGGIIFDTEAETLNNTNKQDYEHLDTILCKAFEHETVSSSFFKHGKKPVSCRSTRLAVMLTSTTTQVENLLGAADSGIKSRILILTFRTGHEWKLMGGDGEDTEDLFERLSHKSYRFFCFCREHPLLFRFSKAQWHELNQIFGSLSLNAYLEDRDELQATVRRYGVCVMRVAMVLTRLTQYEEGTCQSEMYCSETVFRAALSMMLCCYEHCRLLFTSFNSEVLSALKNPNDKVFPLDELPQRFTHAEAVTIGASRGFGRRAVERLLNKLTGMKINKLSRGCYEKVDVTVV